jgi:hypothetical protein
MTPPFCISAMPLFTRDVPVSISKNPPDPLYKLNYKQINS